MIGYDGIVIDKEIIIGVGGIWVLVGEWWYDMRMVRWLRGECGVIWGKVKGVG